MDGISALLGFVATAVAIAIFMTGFSAGTESVEDSCKRYGAFVEGTVKYECKPLGNVER
jgi:hypothetical protein